MVEEWTKQNPDTSNAGSSNSSSSAQAQTTSGQAQNPVPRTPTPGRSQPSFLSRMFSRIPNSTSQSQSADSVTSLSVQQRCECELHGLLTQEDFQMELHDANGNFLCPLKRWKTWSEQSCALPLLLSSLPSPQHLLRLNVFGAEPRESSMQSEVNSRRMSLKQSCMWEKNPSPPQALSGDLIKERRNKDDHWLASHCQMYLPTFEPDDFDEDKIDVGADEALV